MADDQPESITEQLHAGTLKVMDFLPILQMASQTAIRLTARRMLLVHENGVLVTMNQLAERLKEHEAKNQ